MKFLTLFILSSTGCISSANCKSRTWTDSFVCKIHKPRRCCTEI